MNNQEAFDKVYRHFIFEDKPYSVSIDSEGESQCRYRDGNGNCCAAGIFVPDPDYNAGLVRESQVADGGENGPYFRKRGFDIKFLTELQKCHDNSAFNMNAEPIMRKDLFREYLHNVASDHGLTIPTK